MRYTDIFFAREPVPPPPPLPKYDITVEAPKWTWYHIFNDQEMIPQHPKKPKTGGTPDNDEDPDWRGVIKKNIIPLAPPERYNFGNYSPKEYFWFDTPDWADPFKKLKYAAWFFTKYGLCFASTYALTYNFPFNWENITYLMKRPFGRFWVGGMTCSLTVIMLANLRGNKDDLYNYSLGGLAAGAVLGRKNYLAFVRQTFMWVIASSLVKYNAETNGKLLPVIGDPQRLRNLSMGLGGGGDYGIKSGNFRLYHTFPEDVGRALRTHPAW